MSKPCCGPVVWVALNAALWFGGGAATVHLATRTPGSELGSAQRERMELAFDELDLSDDQQEAVDRVLTRYEGEVGEARAEFFQRLQEIETAADEQIHELLSEEQRRRIPGESD